jgi:MerR family transcriptional regulator, thiopeptide resistance regulator
VGNVEKTFLVREFAKLAGVSVRTLHYYDQTGLLRPAKTSSAGHRLYTTADLLRLQQILTLKYMGFSLTEIGELLNSPGYDVLRALDGQKRAIEQQIAGLQQTVKALERTLEMLAGDEGEKFNWEYVQLIIQGVQAEAKAYWLAQYYTPEQLAELKERSQQIDPRQQLKWQQEWQNLNAGITDAARRKLPPDDPAVQALAKEYTEKINLFTKGDPALLESLRRIYSQPDQMPSEFRPYDAETQKYLQKAVDIFNSKR